MKTLKLRGIDEVVYYDECDNGLPIYMWVNDRVNNFYATLNVKYGSMDTEFKYDGHDDYVKVSDGIAHFLEHVKFNESDTTTAHDFYQNLGASINAFTTFNFTSYEVFSSNDFDKCINHLLDYVQKPYFTDALNEKEKGIICEEVKMGKNNPGHKLYYGMNNALYFEDKRRVFVTGDEEDVKGITVDELNLVFDTFYHPKNMYMVITGNFNPDEAVALIKENQARKKFIEYRNPVLKKDNEPSGVVKDYIEIEANIEIPKVKMGFKMSKDLFGDIDPMLLNVYLSVILRNNFGATSLLREELMEKELVTSFGSSREIFNDLVTIEINIETKYPNEVIEIVKEKINNLTITKEEIRRRSKANIAALINDYDDIEYVNSDISEQIAQFGRYYDEIYEVYNGLKLKEAKEIISNMDFSNYTIAVLLPYKD
jgi:predicted Zn-dependent peptidase